jgi:hypothetical protein
LKARNHYTEEFVITLGSIGVRSAIVVRDKKWTLSPEKLVQMASFKINIDDVTLFHNDEELANIEEQFNVTFETILNSESLEYIDPLALNKAMCIYLDFCPIKLKISKQQFTYLMKCLDLNVNYDDGVRELYDFKGKKQFTDLNPIREDYRNLIVDFKLRSISLSLFFLGEFLSEIVCQDVAILVDKYVSTKNFVDISSSALWMFGEQFKDTDNKEIIGGPMGCANTINTTESFYQFDVENNDSFKHLDFNKCK